MERKEEVTQSDFTRNYNNLATRLGLRSISQGGVCYGLTLSFLDHAKNNALGQFFEIKNFLGSLPLNKIKKIARKASEKGDKEDFLVQYNNSTISWNAVRDHIGLIGSAQEHQNDLKFLHTSLEWESTFIVGIYDEKVFQSILSESGGDFIQIGSGVHACAIKRTGNSFLFYDPNNPGPIECSLDELHRHVLSSFSSLEDLNTTHYTLNTLTVGLDPVFDEVIAHFIERFKEDKDFQSIFMSALADYKENKISVQSLISQFVRFVEKKRKLEIGNADEAIAEIKELLHDVEPRPIRLIENSFQFIHSHFKQLDIHKANIKKILGEGHNKTEDNESLHRYLALIIARGDHILLEQVINIIKQLTELDLNSLSADFEKSLITVAAKFGSVNSIKVLERHGMHLEQTSWSGYERFTTEPLFLIAAAKTGQVSVVMEYLPRYNFKIEEKILTEALQAGHVEIIAALLESRQGLAVQELKEHIQQIIDLVPNLLNPDSTTSKNEVIPKLLEIGFNIENKLLVSAFKKAVEVSNFLAARAIMKAEPQLVEDLYPLQALLMENIVRMNSVENKNNIRLWAHFSMQARPPDAFILDSSLELLDLLKPERFTPEDAKTYLTQAIANQSWAVAAVLLLSMKDLTVRIGKRQKRQIVDAYLELLSNKVEQKGKSPETDREVEMIMQRENALGILFHQPKDITGLMFTSYNDEKKQKTTSSVRRLLDFYNAPEPEAEKKLAL